MTETDRHFFFVQEQPIKGASKSPTPLPEIPLVRCPIRTLLYENLCISCAWEIDVVIYNDVSMTRKSSVRKCYLQYIYIYIYIYTVRLYDPVKTIQWKKILIWIGAIVD